MQLVFYWRLERYNELLLPEGGYNYKMFADSH